ncbi:MAG: carbohydrate binding family 9 domain-containing protein, partial [Candidatus Aminicenantes bacterium]|nr:carbohydrate binding family 9 domain-containing protein [Candidatus Aminicenantes bacterium]
IDGRLLEPLWQRAEPVGPLTMVEPDEGAPASEQTEVRVVAKVDALYFGIICHDRSPEKIVSHTMKRDAYMRGQDHIKIVLDPFMNGRTGYIFAVNPDGARYDALVEREGGGENEQWDGIWEAAAHRSEAGWSVEICIPVKTLRFGPGLSRWGFNVERRIERLLETDRWAAPNRNFRVTNISQAGKLVSIPTFRQGRGLTIRPYTLGSRTHDEVDTTASNDIEAGLDILKNFGSNVTGLLSVNTDFAETEADTRQVNLTRFPLFFPEKRTFFLEGSDIFDFGLGLGTGHQRDIIPFFSRRIGLIETDDEEDEGNQIVPLAIAGKATGSIDRFSFGILNSLVEPVEGLSPRTNLFAARGYQGLWEESKIGFLVTAGDPLGRNNSWQAGIDFVYKTSTFQGNKNFLFGIWGLVNNREDLGKDKTAIGMKIDFPNDLWDVSLAFKRIGADYDPSMGFVPWQGIYKVNFDLTFKPRPDWFWLRLMRHEFFTHFVWDLSGRIQQWRVFIAPVNWQLESGDRFEFNIVPNMERIPEEFEITPEVIVKTGKYNWWRYRLEFHSASKRSITTKFTWWFGTLYDGSMNQYQAELGWRPSHHMNISFEGEWNKGRLSAGGVDIRLGRARFDMFVSPNLQILTYLQYDSLTKELGLNTRLRYTYRSLLDIFLVYNRNWLETSGTLRPEINQFFIKIQYSWRS